LLQAAASGPDLATLVVRRVAGEPLEHLLGWVEFAGARYVVTPDVFVPRRRSELLVSVVEGIVRRRNHHLRAVPDDFGGGLSVVVVDLCCGAGAIGAAISARIPDAEVWASDVDPAAVACARRNLPPERVVEGDLYDGLPAGLRGRIGVVVANAPYVPTDAIATMPPEARDHEPRIALDGGPDGLDLHRRVLGAAQWWLAPGGVVVIETSAAQATETAAAAQAAGLTPRVVTDEEREATAVVATLPPGKNSGPPYAGPL